MKKQALLLALFCFSMTMATISAYGQTVAIKAKVPFEFMAGEQRFPAGEYRFSSVQHQVLIQNSEGKILAMMMADWVSGRSTERTSVLFDCYVDQCFLSQLWGLTQDTGRQVVKSRREEEMTKRQTGKYLTLLGNRTPK